MEPSGSPHLPIAGAGLPADSTVTAELADIILRTEQCGICMQHCKHTSAKHTAAETTPAANSTDENDAERGEEDDTSGD